MSYLCSVYTGPCGADEIAKRIGGKAGTERVYVKVDAKDYLEAIIKFRELFVGIWFSLPKAHEINCKGMDEFLEEYWEKWM